MRVNEFQSSLVLETGKLLQQAYDEGFNAGVNFREGYDLAQTRLDASSQAKVSPALLPRSKSPSKGRTRPRERHQQYSNRRKSLKKTFSQTYPDSIADIQRFPRYGDEQSSEIVDKDYTSPSWNTQESAYTGNQRPRSPSPRTRMRRMIV